jgi:hypothetical protein
MLTEALNAELSSDTWKFAGAVTAMLAARLVPETVYDPGVEAEPTFTLPKLVSAGTDAVTAGVVLPPVPVPLTETKMAVAVPLVFERYPERAPEAVGVNRT